MSVRNQSLPDDLIVGISGASGMPYAAEFLRAAFDAGLRLHVIVTAESQPVLLQERSYRGPMGRDFDVGRFCGRLELNDPARVFVYDPSDMLAPPASGSFRARGMVIAPCSMRTLGALASGVASNLLLRAAECQLKERRRLVLVPRETPLSVIHLENMARLAHAGATILPAMPAYYYRPHSLEDHERFLTTKICDQFDIAYDGALRWEGDEAADGCGGINSARDGEDAP